jgi:hypothetical protein
MFLYYALRVRFILFALYTEKEWVDFLELNGILWIVQQFNVEDRETM